MRKCIIWPAYPGRTALPRPRATWAIHARFTRKDRLASGPDFGVRFSAYVLEICWLEPVVEPRTGRSGFHAWLAFHKVLIKLVPRV